MDRKGCGAVIRGNLFFASFVGGIFVPQKDQRSKDFHQIFTSLVWQIYPHYFILVFLWINRFSNIAKFMLLTLLVRAFLKVELSAEWVRVDLTTLDNFWLGICMIMKLCTEDLYYVGSLLVVKEFDDVSLLLLMSAVFSDFSKIFVEKNDFY